MPPSVGERRAEPVGATLVLRLGLVFSSAFLIESGIHEAGASVARPTAIDLTSSLSVKAPPPGGMVFTSSRRNSSDFTPVSLAKIGCILSSKISPPLAQYIGSQTVTALVRRSVPATKP